MYFESDEADARERENRRAKHEEERMYASKENAQKARKTILELRQFLQGQHGLIDWPAYPEGEPNGFQFVEQFLVAAERKLPSDASYRREEMKKESRKAVTAVRKMEIAEPKRKKKLANG